MALCGGVNCILDPQLFVALSKARMTSPQGTSKPFSSQADGYGRGEGCGVLLLKTLENALRDRNKIWGVVSKTGVNQDGRSVSPITKPSRRQQEELLRKMYSERDLAQVQYIEAHGTGTPVGDTTEAAGISEAVALANPGLWMGSVKGNIGHLESASGVAGLIKVLLMMKHQTVVPSLFYSRDAASIDAKVLGMDIPTKAQKWTANGSQIRVAGINSFGFGGTNAHAILREHHQRENLDRIPEEGLQVFVTSAASEQSLIRSLRDTHRRLVQTVDLRALCYTSACGRSHAKHKYRQVVVTPTLSDLRQKLAKLSEGHVVPAKSKAEVVFVFSGNGVAFHGMCQELFSAVPVFQEKVLEVELLFQKKNPDLGISRYLCGESTTTTTAAELRRPDVVQPLLFAIQVALATFLKHLGVKPAAVLGHSLGEVSAAHCSGLLSLEDAVYVVFHRSMLQSSVAAGKMLAVGNVLPEKVLDVLRDFSEDVSLAAFNSPQSCTLSGDEAAVDAVHDKLSSAYADQVFLHALDVPAAYHSHLMEPILQDIRSILGDLAVHHMDCDLFSTVTGRKYVAGDFGNGSYWAKNIREPVLFEQTLRAVAKDYPSYTNLVFLEIGPRQALHKYIRETLGNDLTVLSWVQAHNQYQSLLSTLGELFQLGVQVSWESLYRGHETWPTEFPVYHFDYSKKRSFEEVRKVRETSPSPSHSSISPIRGDHHHEYTCHLTADYLSQHKHNGVAVVPGAFYVELAFASVLDYLNPKTSASCVQLGLKFHHLLGANGGPLKVNLTETQGLFTIGSPTATHASGTFRCTEEPAVVEEPTICPEGIWRRCTSIVTSQEFYAILSRAGFEHGSVFKHLADVHLGEEFQEALTTIHVPKELFPHLCHHTIHPVLLDRFLQMTAAVACRDLSARPAFPTAIGSVVVLGPLPEEFVIYMRVTKKTSDLLKVCGCFATKDGKVLVELRDVQVDFLGGSWHVPPSIFFHNETIPIPSQSNGDTKIRALVFADKLGLAEALAPYLHPESRWVDDRETWTPGQLRDIVLGDHDSVRDVLFIWSAEDLGHLPVPDLLERSVACCESFRQIVLTLKECRRSCTVRVITYRSTEKTADCVTSAFALYGMTRAVAAEVSSVSFQLIDLMSLTATDVEALVGVINSCGEPEVVVGRGRVSTTRVTRTPMLDMPSPKGDLKSFVLQTGHPYRIQDLSATEDGANEETVPEESVKVRLTVVCVHSTDYFPVTFSQLRFGTTLYWNQHTAHRHTLLALDFGGVVTSVGKDVRHLRVGDRMASTYPIEAAARVVVPGSACYPTKKLPFLKECPSVSFFILAWEILQRTLPTAKPRRKKMSIIAPDLASAFTKVLALAANRSGWNVSCVARWSKGDPSPHPCQAFVLLPPYDQSQPDLSDLDLHDCHLVYVHGSEPASPCWPAQSGLVHVIHVSQVLQRAYLREQGVAISRWLSSLGLDGDSLPVKTESFQAKDGLNHSYFSTKTVRQVVLESSSPNCQVSDMDTTPPQKPRPLFDQSRAYIVSGGLTGLGLETVKFIAHQGGGGIVTLCRRAPTPETRSQLDALEKRYQVAIANIRCDVSAWPQVEDAVRKTEETLRLPIGGVFHGAGVLHDAPLENLDRFTLRKVLRPKVSGVVNLHRATLTKNLDYFVCHSSVSSVLGNECQSNYAAANSFLDKFCLYRRNLGLAGQSINWGPLNLGLLRGQNQLQRHLEAKGLRVMEAAEIHPALARVLLADRPQQLVCKFDFEKAFLRERLPALAEAELRDQGGRGVYPPLPPLSSPLENVRRTICQVSGSSPDQLDLQDTLGSLGVDSMSALTLQNRFSQEAGLNVPLVTLLDPNTTVATLETLVTNNQVLNSTPEREIRPTLLSENRYPSSNASHSPLKPIGHLAPSIPANELTE
ncbi:phenolphthiocerol synthesis polyketide synthase type I Pks15/1-like [Stigmatopora nigra]